MSGRVAIVGAGPGDPGLLTARALELIAWAEVILYDRLIPEEALSGAQPGTELVYVGKEGGKHGISQEEIQQLMLDHAGAGRRVLRLKGGDPFVFGRGGEETAALRAAGIPYEVVPGITAGIAAPAYAGIPVTHRERASGVALVTAHEAKEEGALNWRALAGFPGTLVFYMGVSRIGVLAQHLIDGGRPGDEPVAVIERGSLPDQRTIAGTLATIAQLAADAQVRAPAVTVVGPVVELRDEGPLAGRTVAVTRARAQASELAVRLRALGAEVLQTPAIRIVPLAAQAPPLEDFDLLCLTSANGAELLFEALARDGRDARALAGLQVAAIGPGTAAALRAHGVIADIVPERFVAEGLIEALADVPVRRALIARAAQARDVLPDALRERGAEVEVLPLYETVAEPVDAQALARADYVTFTSSSTVRFLLASATLGERTRVVSIGPVTSETLREHGIEPDVEAQRHDVDGLIDALLADA